KCVPSGSLKSACTSAGTTMAHGSRSVIPQRIPPSTEPLPPTWLPAGLAHDGDAWGAGDAPFWAITGVPPALATPPSITTDTMTVATADARRLERDLVDIEPPVDL